MKLGGRFYDVLNLLMLFPFRLFEYMVKKYLINSLKIGKKSGKIVEIIDMNGLVLKNDCDGL